MSVHEEFMRLAKTKAKITEKRNGSYTLAAGLKWKILPIAKPMSIGYSKKMLIKYVPHS